MLFPKIYNRTNKFGINNKSQFDFLFSNWKHQKNNAVLTAPPKPEKKKIVPEIAVPEINKQQQQQQQPLHEQQQQQQLQQHYEQQQQQEQQQQHEQKELEGKNPESYEKRVPHPLEQVPGKIESFIPPSVTKTVLAAPKNITPSAKSFMDAKVARKRAEKKARLQKQLDENTKKMNVIKNAKIKINKNKLLLNNLVICRKY